MAKANIGSLVVSILAATGPFENGMRKGRKQLTDFEKRVEKTNKVIGRLKTGFVALSAAVTTGALAMGFKEVAGSLDELKKKSDVLGISANELRALRFAGEQTGVSMDQMDNALEKMVRRISEATQGTGTAVKALAALNLEAESMNRLAPEKQFTTIARALGNISNQGDKVRIAYELFGRDSEIVNTLAAGGAGIEALTRQFKELGGVFSQSELENVEKFNDSMNAISKAFEGLKGRLVIDMAPGLTEVVDGLVEYMSGARELARQAELRRQEREGKKSFAQRASEGIASHPLFSSQLNPLVAARRLRESIDMRDYDPTSLPEELSRPQSPTIVMPPQDMEMQKKQLEALKSIQENTANSGVEIVEGGL